MIEIVSKIGESETKIVLQLNGCSVVGSALEGAISDAPVSRVLLVTDDQVGRLYAPAVLQSLAAAGFLPFEHRIRPGEHSKSISSVAELYYRLASEGFGRDGVILALGGGVVSDLAGFVAATWMRGVRWAVCPTTVEACIDAALGGKTAINIPGGKNLVGAFHHPVLVLVDAACLRSLDPRDFRAGLAESVKHALIVSDEFLDWHEAHADAVLAGDETKLGELILRNLRIKSDIVAADAEERGDRRIVLNLGHTIGHAIEECSGFALRHGECVALGLIAACRLSHLLGLLDQAVVNRAEALLARLGLPTRLANPIETGDIMAAIALDKKVQSGAVRWILLAGIGRPIVRSDVPESLARQAYESLLQ